MSLAKIAPRHRAALSVHGWLLFSWSVGLGVLTSAFLLHVVHVDSMVVRYAVSSSAFYLGGFIFGGWWYVRWWRSCGPAVPERANPHEEIAYDQAQEAIRKKSSWWDGINWLPDAGGGDDPISLILLAIAVVFLLAIVASMLWMLPALVSDALGGYLAELVIEFVLGAVLLRRISRPRRMEDYWSHALRGTGPAGVAVIALFTGAGFLMQHLDPHARTLLEFVRHL